MRSKKTKWKSRRERKKRRKNAGKQDTKEEKEKKKETDGHVCRLWLVTSKTEASVIFHEPLPLPPAKIMAPFLFPHLLLVFRGGNASYSDINRTEVHGPPRKKKTKQSSENVNTFIYVLEKVSQIKRKILIPQNYKGKK